MALTHAEPRLAPLGSASFQVSDLQPRALKRSHSYSGYAPHRLRLSLDGATGSPPSSAAACTAAAAEGGAAASAQGVGASEAPSSPRKCSSEATTRADSLVGEESSTELWPDTDDDSEETYEWTPCSRRGAVAPAAATLQILATIPSAGATCCPGAGAAVQFAPAPPVAPLPPHGRARGAGTAPGVAAPWGPVGQPLAPLLPLAAMAGQAWLGGACSPPAPGAPAGGGGLQSAMRAAESALAALEAAEAAEAEAAEGAEVPACTEGPARQSRQGPRHLPQGVTSLMVRSLPQEVSQRGLLEEVHRSGFAGRVDFCYMPRDFTSGRNRGHAFLNFTSPEAAAEFCQAWHGRPTCGGRRASGPCGVDISVATLQGLAANVAKWDCPRTRRVRNPDYRPFVLAGGAAHAVRR